MQLPVDFKALLDEATNIKAAKATPIALSVYIDESAPASLSAHVRNAFASTLPTVRMTVTYIDADFIPKPTDDVAVIVAGNLESIGRYAADLRNVGVPVMVVADQNSPSIAAAIEQGFPIPAGDLITLQGEGEADEAAGPLEGKPALSLDDRMGRWIVSVCRDKRLAYAIAFPFVRRPLAQDAVRTTALQNAGVGAIPFIMGADLPILTLNQAKMVLQIGAAYGQEIDATRWKEIAAVVAAAYFSRGLVRKLVAAVPVLGVAVKAGVAYGSTAAIGYGVIEYFEGGQNVTGVANVVEKAASTGKRALTTAKTFSARLPLPAPKPGN